MIIGAELRSGSLARLGLLFMLAQTGGSPGGLRAIAAIVMLIADDKQVRGVTHGDGTAESEVDDPGPAQTKPDAPPKRGTKRTAT